MHFYRTLSQFPLTVFAILLISLAHAASPQDAKDWLDAHGYEYEYEDPAALKEFKELLPFAEQGDARAQFLVGSSYQFGQGVPQDYAQAVDWYRKAAAQGNASAQYKLGRLYEQGQGVPQDYAQAVDWYRKAALRHHANAQNNLGSLYLNGEGVLQDYDEAYAWYRLGATQGDALAQKNLGLMYFTGKGRHKNYVHAYMWFNLAAAQDEEDAREIRDEIEGKMTFEEISEAQRLAREWLAQHQK
jgi:TPR repeat protein